ncbi:MAG: Ig-like domain-containing protein [Candidatus Limnocylindria bacterium]
MDRRSVWPVLGVLVMVLAAISPAGGGAAQAAETNGTAPAATLADDDPTRYIVQFSDEPLALYDGGVAGLAPTMPAARGELRLDPSTPDSVAYLSYLDTQQAARIAAIEAALNRSVDVVFTYRTVFNGVAIALTSSEAATVAAVPGVVRVERDQVLELLTDNGPAWMNADEIWSGDATGTATMGEGVVAGIIDTGINGDHPSFADIGGDGYDHTNPRVAHFGECAIDLTKCNDKLIGMYDFTGTGAEDDNGHGSHTASTVAGNVVDATLYAPTVTVGPRRISGVAPHANIISYKACTDQVFIALTGCQLTALYAAIEQATIDMVDVINFSIGGGSQDPWAGIFAQPFFGTQAAGVFVAASAGNSGPGPQTIGAPSNAPWLMSVGASTHDRRPSGTVTTSSAGGAGPSFTGMTVAAGLASTVLIDAVDVGNELCDPFNATQAAQVAGKLVICTQGLIGRVAKGQHVKDAGGAGMILTAQPGVAKASVVADTHVLPAVMISEWDGEALRAWLAGATDPQAALSGVFLEESPALADRMAYFSSRGPDLTSPNVIKPDVTAPGVAIWAAFASHSGPATAAEYNVIQGTSMSSPHAAGAAVLVRGLRPSWTPDNVKSALMSTGFTAPAGGKETVAVTKEDHTTAADPFDRGAGRVDVANAAKAGFVMQESLAGYQGANPALGGDPRQINLASLADENCAATCTWTRTLTSAAASSVTWTVSATSSSGLRLSVEPSAFTLAPDLLGLPTTQAITVTGTNTGLVPGSWEFGEITFTPDVAGIPEQHFPVAVKTTGGTVEPACEIPETVVATDGNEINVAPQHNIREVAVSGLYPTFAGQATPVITFRLKVTHLDPLPPESHWRVAFVPPGTPSGTTYFVQMVQGLSGEPSFVYGTITGGSFTVLGAPESGSWSPDGNITITIAASKVLDPKVGDTLTGIIGAAGPAHPGALTTNVDSTTAGEYTLRACEDSGPIANADSATTTENTPVVIDVLANDASPSGGELTVTEVTSPANGTATNNGDGTVTYTPAAGFSGVDSFSYTVTDPEGRTASAPVSVTVAPFCPTEEELHDFESGSGDWRVETAENEFGNDLSPAWAVTTDLLAKSGTSSFTSDGPTWTKDDRLIAPAADITSVGTITFWHRFGFEEGFDGGVLEVSTDAGATWRDVTDPLSGGSFVKGGYNGTISPSDGSAIAGRDAWTGGDGSEVTGTMTEVVVNVGALAGQDVLFRWRLVTDALVISMGWWVDDVTFAGLATECNEPPVAQDDSAVTEEGRAVTIDVLANDSDPDGDELTVSTVSDPADGTTTINSDNTVTYTPDAGFVGTETFTYTAFDGEWEDTATVTVTVEERPNTAPVANDDTVTTARNTEIVIDVLANDHDADGDPLDVTAVTQPAEGRAMLNADDTVTYTPAINFSGTETFTYDIDDGHGGTAVGNVTVNVGEPGAPVACFTFSPRKPKAGNEMKFDARCTTDDNTPDDLLLFEWDFQSDGTIDATGMRPRHTFDVGGTYTVTLRVTDTGGSTDVLRRDIDVRD